MSATLVRLKYPNSARKPRDKAVGMVTKCSAGISDARIAATRDSKGSWLMVYSPNSTITIDTGSLTGCNVTASWFSPVSGEYTKFDYEQCTGTGVRRFELPVGDDHQDWALVFDAHA